jgi:glycosyltransferase involved in cell wall biosynthesis
LVNSEWSRQALQEQGVPETKMSVVPLAYEAPASLGVDERRIPLSTCEFLRILWLGQVNVRKGIHYLIEAARQLTQEKIQFEVVGPISLNPEIVATAPRNIRFHGPVNRSEAANWYKCCDVFVLPTLSDGFALTQLEALAHGLPAITTPNCGSVVEDGKTGYIVPARDASALAERLRHLAKNPELVASMSPHCRKSILKYSLSALGRELGAMVTKHFPTSAK